MPHSGKILSLFERLGEETLERVVYAFYDKCLADPRINKFFKNMDMRVLSQHQYDFIMYVTGGAEVYNGQSLRNAHKRLVEEKGLDDSHFDAVVENLRKSFEEVGVGYNTVEEVMTIVAATRDDVLNR